MVVRLLFFLALAAVVVAGGLYLITRDRRYLRFIGLTLRYTLFLLAGVLLFYAFERLVLAL